MKNKILPVIAAAVVVVAALTVVFVPKGGKQSQESNSAKIVSADSDIEIKLDDLSADTASVLSYNLDGTEIGLLAIKDNEGNIHAAFNTCQVCNGSPRAYFEQKNGRLICQNCGNQFELSSIGASAMGCNPITIKDDYITKTDEGIVISREFLEANKKLFTNWKKL